MLRIMAALPSTQFTYRSYSNFKLVSGHPDYQPIPNFKDPEGNVKTFQYSKDGRYLGWASPESVKIIDTESIEIINEIPKKNVVEIGFSPKG
ncbi:12124_t:CDS:2, partial [Acaulospora morrowiae]